MMKYRNSGLSKIDRGEIRQYLLILIIVFTLFACEPEPTPFPVDLPVTPTPTIAPAALPPLRYALLPNTANLLPDLALLQASADVITLTDANVDLNAYDVVAGYGILTDWTRSDITPHVTLILNTALPPLNNPQITALIRQSLDPQAISATLTTITGVEPFPLATTPSTTIRTELANLGYPDGIAFVIGTAAVPGVETIAAQMQAANIDAQLLLIATGDVRAALDSGRIQLAVVMWGLEREREQWIISYGAENVLDLFTLPISYRVASGLTISFTPLGFPLVTR